MGLVLPAELMSVNYAAEVRRFLLRRFGTVRLVLFEDLVFPGVLEEVVVLLAEGSGGADRFEVFQAKSMSDLVGIAGNAWTPYAPRDHEKWTSALLPIDTLTLYRQVTGGTGFEVLLDWGETYLGAVTGCNDYFAISKAKARELRLPLGELLRIVPPGSRHLQGIEFSTQDWRRLASDNQPCCLFAPRGRPSAAGRRYIAQGEGVHIQEAYKCRVRTPWWRVPLVPRPDFLLTYMNHDHPRLVRNSAGAHILNSLYGVRLHAERRRLGQELLHLAFLNSVTLLGAEIVGRSYGGGLLKLEPKEADLLPVPSLDALRNAATRLRSRGETINTRASTQDARLAMEQVDRALLRDELGMAMSDIERFRQARSFLFQRRMARAKGQNGAH